MGHWNFDQPDPSVNGAIIQAAPATLETLIGVYTGADDLFLQLFQLATLDPTALGATMPLYSFPVVGGGAYPFNFIPPPQNSGSDGRPFLVGITAVLSSDKNTYIAAGGDDLQLWATGRN